MLIGLVDEALGEIFQKKSQPYIFSAYSKSLVVGAAPGRALPRLGFFFLESALKACPIFRWIVS
jgi:hypothetical protein